MNKLQTDVRPHAVRDYLTSCTNDSRETMRTAIRRGLSVMANCPVEQVDPVYLASDEVIDNFKNLTAASFELMLMRLQKKYSQRTAALTATAIRGVVQKLRREKDITGKRLISADEYLDIMDVKLPRIPKDQEGRTFLETDEVGSIINACKADDTLWGIRDLAILTWILTQGARASEVVNAKLQHYDPATGILTIHQGKGKKTRRNQLANGATAAMEKWLEVRGDKPGALFPAIKYFETTILHEQNMTPHALAKILDKRQKKAGVYRVVKGKRRGKYSPHAFRRTAGDKIANELGLEVAQVILGHSDINTTRQAYTRRNVGAALEACKELS